MPEIREQRVEAVGQSEGTLLVGAHVPVATLIYMLIDVTFSSTSSIQDQTQCGHQAGYEQSPELLLKIQDKRMI